LRERTVDPSSPRELFAELVEASLAEVGANPSPAAVIYLVDLLVGRMRAPEPTDPEATPTLGESLLLARLERGPARAGMLRDLGDRSLFVAGFFGESLHRGPVGVGYYRDIGCAAYADLSRTLAARTQQPVWPGLFRELAERFEEFVDLLSAVGSRARTDGPIALLRLYDRFVRTGSSRDRAELLRRGLVPPSPTGRCRLQ